MTKKTSNRKGAPQPGFRRYSAGTRIVGAQKPVLERFGNWLGRLSRLNRTFIAGFVALVLTAALVLLVYAFVLNIGPASLSFYLSEHLELLTVGLIVFSIIGFGFYWVGWRLLIGFDLGDKSVVPGQGAGLWVAAGIFVLIVMVVMMALTIADALQ